MKASREEIPSHLTSSAVVIESDHILLVHHRRIGAWLPPGGHLDPYEMPHEAAIRETLEETGLAVRVLSPKQPGKAKREAFILPSPLCLHGVKAHENGKDVYHLDLAFLCRPITPEPSKAEASEIKLPELRVNPEVKDARWQKLSELGSIQLANNVVEIVEMALQALAQGRFI